MKTSLIHPKTLNSSLSLQFCLSPLFISNSILFVNSHYKHGCFTKLPCSCAIVYRIHDAPTGKDLVLSCHSLAYINLKSEKKSLEYIIECSFFLCITESTTDYRMFMLVCFSMWHFACCEIS